jgi:hypothetical protein
MSSSTVPLPILRVVTGAWTATASFCEMRRKIRADRIKMKQDQELAQQEFWDNLILWSVSSFLVVVGCVVLWFLVDLLFTVGAKR